MTESWRGFRFRKVNENLWHELELSELYACSPKRLNDPFDCGVDWARACKRALASEDLDTNRRRTIEEIEAAFRQVDPMADPRLEPGVCCFSLDLDNTLMWSHYADAHRGVCLLYDLPNTYFRELYPPPTTASEPSKEFFFVGQQKVGYGDNVFSDWLTTGDLRELPVSPIENAVARLLTAKSAAWGYELESRLVFSHPGFVKLEPRFLTQVTFGLRTPDHHRRSIARVAKRANPEVAFSEVVKSVNSDLALEFREVDG